MKTLAIIMTTIVCLTIITVSVIAKPHLPHHKTNHFSHSKLEHKHHVYTKSERQMRRLQCGNESKPLNINF
jgi:hypothetical protein